MVTNWKCINICSFPHRVKCVHINKLIAPRYYLFHFNNVNSKHTSDITHPEKPCKINKYLINYPQILKIKHRMGMLWTGPFYKMIIKKHKWITILRYYVSAMKLFHVN